MRCFRVTASVLLLVSSSSAAELPRPLATGLKNTESVCLGPGGAGYVTEIGDFDKDGDGQVSVLKDGKPQPFATGLNDLKGIIASPDALYVADKTRVVKIDMTGKVTTIAAPDGETFL